jgi:15-cis-phytoene synthase/lycopene beta-cyclase
MGSLLRRAALPASLSLLALAVLGIAASSHSSSMDAPYGATFEGHNRGSWTSEPCQFSYARFHLYLTIPPTVFLYLLNRPFLTRLDRAKLIFLPAIAFVWTTPWDNELVRQRAWRYPRSCVIGTVGYVPIEEYFFVSKQTHSQEPSSHWRLTLLCSLTYLQFIIQSVKTVLFASFVTRWLLPTFYVFETRAEKQRSFFARWSVVAVSCCLTAMLAGLAMTRPGEHSYYLGMIMWWCSLPLALLGWGSSNFVARMPWNGGKGAFLVTLVFPTAYLWATDIFALRRGTWHINVSQNVSSSRVNGFAYSTNALKTSRTSLTGSYLTQYLSHTRSAD